MILIKMLLNAWNILSHVRYIQKEKTKTYQLLVPEKENNQANSCSN